MLQHISERKAGSPLSWAKKANDKSVIILQFIMMIYFLFLLDLSCDGIDKPHPEQWLSNRSLATVIIDL